MTVVRFNVCWKVGTAAPPAGEECYKGRLISLYHVKTLFDILNSNVVSDWLDLFCHKIDFEMFPVLWLNPQTEVSSMQWGGGAAHKGKIQVCTH